MAETRSRQAYILDRLARDGSLSVAALSHDLGVSEVTIRASLKQLEARGLLTRTHGGAQASSFQNVLERQRHHAEAKAAIATRAANLVHDGDAILVEAGTTTAALVRALTGKTVQVVTNSTLAFAAARLNPALSLTLVGGRFHPESESLVGFGAVRSLVGFNARLAFIGTDGFTLERGLTTQFADGAEVIRAMASHAEETWVLADSSKYGRAGFVNVLGLGAVSGIITDAGIGPESLSALREAGLRVLVAE